MIADNTPVIIGVGQYSERLGGGGLESGAQDSGPQDSGRQSPGELASSGQASEALGSTAQESAAYRALSPMDLAGEALAAAIADSNADADSTPTPNLGATPNPNLGAVANAIDTLAAIPQFEISSPKAAAPFGKSNNVPRSIARRVGANPQRAILEVVGGQAPQRLVGELASEIAAGRSQCAAIVGAEAISTMLAHLKNGETPDWSEDVAGDTERDLEARGYGMDGLVEKSAAANGLTNPIALYALFENARRAQLGLNLEQYRQKMGALFAPFTQIAAANPHAAAPIERTAQELAAISPRNRIVAELYPRMMVARDQVNQSAAIIIASAAMARALGVPQDRWVHIHSICDAREAPVLARPDLAASPAAIASVKHALNTAAITQENIRFFDLYSCFAGPVFNILDGLGLAADDPRGLTLTGGLPFFGGAGNNYSGHAIVEAVQKLRAHHAAKTALSGNEGETGGNSEFGANDYGANDSGTNDSGAKESGDSDSGDSDNADFAMVGANGGYMSKYAVGLYAMKPADWSQKRWHSLPDPVDRVEVKTHHSGPAHIESFTIIEDKASRDRKNPKNSATAPPYTAATAAPPHTASTDAIAVIAARCADGTRIVARLAPQDARGLAEMRKREPIGREVWVEPAPSSAQNDSDHSEEGGCAPLSPANLLNIFTFPE